MNVTPGGSELTDAVAVMDLAAVQALLQAGADPNAVRAPGGEETHQPDRPLKMVMFRLSDALLSSDDRSVLATIAAVLLDHGADPGPAMEVAQSRYGEYPGPDDEDTWEAWHVVAAAAHCKQVTVGATLAATSESLNKPMQELVAGSEPEPNEKS